MRRWLYVLVPWLVLLPLGAGARVLRAAPDGVFTVTTTGDVNDAAVGDGLCETATGNGVCTLRAAIQEARAGSGPSSIFLPAGLYVLSRTGFDDTTVNGDLDLGGTLTITGAGPAETILDASAMNDRVFHVISGTVTISRLTLQNGRPSGAGGAMLIAEDAAVTLADAVITRSHTGSGGGIFNAGRLMLIQSAVYSNTVTSTGGTALGGGITIHSGVLELVDSHIYRNSSGGHGGGLFASSAQVTLTRSTLNDNAAMIGGGVYASVATLRLVNSTVAANEAGQAGGGIYASPFSTVSLYNSTVAENEANLDANSSADGGGIAAALTTTVTLHNSLIADNWAIDWTGPLLVPSDCSGGLISAGANYVGDTNDPCSITGIAPLTGGFALLGPLANHGGPTPTHALLPGSPAIDAGALAGCTGALGELLVTDQRGAPRPAFGGTAPRCDLGAYERQAVVLLPLTVR